MTSKRLLVALALSLLSAPAFADCRAEANVLFPLNSYGRGANGSEWSLLPFVLNLSNQPLAPPGVNFLTLCPIPEGCPSSVVPPHEAAVIVGPGNTNGFVMRLTRDQASQIVPTLRLFEIKSQTVVDIPVLRDDDYYATPIWLPVVQINSVVRTTLRIYQPDGRALSARVSVYPYADVTHALDSKVLTASESSNCAIPSFASATLQDLFPEVASQNSYVNVKIEPQAPVERFWAFASSADNQTNHTHIVAPN